MTTSSPENSSPDNAPPRKPRRVNSLYVFIALIVALYFINYRPDIPTVACADDMSVRPAVVMLATSWCPYCASARRYFHRENIEYCEYDVERSATGKRLYDELGGGGVPILIIGDRYRINGFDEHALERALQKLRSGSGETSDNTL